LQPIGTIHSPYTTLQDMPIQPKGAARELGTIQIFSEYTRGLRDLEGFSHIYLLYQFHMAERTELSVIPFMDSITRGVFATRSPLRPNHIGLSIVELIDVKDNIVTVRGIDVLDGTPLLDIKPYIAAFDEVRDSRSGWMQASSAEVAAKRSDDRFAG
jgi:tRNA (adenine37-N6)-methyltransferase